MLYALQSNAGYYCESIIQTMSFQKKSLILQELEQAIRKKAQEKSKNKEQVGRVLQGSVERKKQALKTATKPEARLSSALRQSENSQKPPPDKAISIFGQEPAFEGSQLRAKKYNNRRLDKLLSLVQYLLSSSEKALRFISPSNFEAEFALKLYRSDRENLLNQLKNLTVEDIIDSQRQVQKSRPEEVNQLAEENAKLKKEILLLQKQAQNYLKSKAQPIEARGGSTRQNTKMKQILRKVIPFESFKQLSQLLDKQARFELMAAKSQENSKKTTEIEIVLSSLENQRSLIVENLAKLREASKTDRSGRFTQIQGQKQQLQKEVGMMKSKLADMMQANKALAELELLKKNSEVMHERFIILAKDLQLSTKKGSEQLFEHIRSAVQLQQQNQSVVTQKAEQAGKEVDFLRSRLKEVEEERAELQKELRSSEEQARVESMLRQMQKFKQVIDELGEQQQLSSQRIASLQQQLNAKQSEIDQLKGLVEAREEQIDSNEEEKQVLLNKLSERQQLQQSLRQKVLAESRARGQLQQKLDKAIKEKQLLQNQFANVRSKSIKESQQSQSQIIDELQSLRRQLGEKEEYLNKLQQQLASMQQRIGQDTNLLKEKALQINRLREEMRHMKNTREEDHQLREQLEVIAQQRNELKEKFQDLAEDHQQLKEEFNKIKDSMNSLNQIQTQYFSQRDELKLAKEQLEASRKQIDTASKRSQQSLSRVTEELATLKREIILIEKEKGELEGVKAVLQQRLGVSEEEVECLQRKTQSLQAEVNQLQQEIRSLTLVSNEVHNSMEQSRQILSSLEDQKIELARELVTAKQQLQDSSELARFRSRQYVSLLRQILKGLQIDPSEYEDKQSFEELLELGSQQVLQLRKKQRDQQSIKRRHGRKQQDSPSEQVQLKEVSVRLFNHQPSQDRVSPQEAQTVQQKTQNILEQSEEITPEKNSHLLDTEKAEVNSKMDSQIKEDNEKQQKQQQKDDQLIDGQDFSIALPQKLSLNSVYHARKSNKLQTLDEFQELGNSKLGESLVSQQSNQKSLEQASQKNEESFDMNDKISEHSNKSHRKQQVQVDQGNFEQEIYMQNDSMLYSIQLNLQSSITKQEKQQRDPKFNPYSKHTMQSVALKKEKLDLDDFEEAKSVNNSFVSIRDVPQDHQGPPEDYVELPHVDLEATIKPNLDEDDDEGKGIEQFGELQPNLLSQSMLSQAKSEGQVDIDEFGQLRDNLGASMVSQSIEENERSKEQQLNLDQFGDLKENLGASMVSQQSEEEVSKSKEELGLDEFGDLQEHLNNSMRSQTHSQHGLSQFGDLQDGNLGQSMVSQGQGLSEFGEVDQGLNQSLISQKEEND